MAFTLRRNNAPETAILLVGLLLLSGGCKLDEGNLGGDAAVVAGGDDAGFDDTGVDDAGVDGVDDVDGASGTDVQPDVPADPADGPVDQVEAPAGAVACRVSAWGDFQPCSKPCGGGTQSRVRTVLTPAMGGGAPCPTLVETQGCNLPPCPADCVTSAWSPWSACNKACGGGARWRSRTVVRPPTAGGAACGELMQTEACNVAAVNGCGGCGKLALTPQAACGTCGKVVCAGPDQTTCEDPARTCQQAGATCGAPSDGCGGKLSCGDCLDALTSCAASFACGCGRPTSLGSPGGGLEIGKQAVSPDGRFFANAGGIHQSTGQLVMSLDTVKGFDWHPSQAGRFAIMRHFSPPLPLCVVEVYDIDASAQAMLKARAESNSQWHHFMAWDGDGTIALGAENVCQTVSTIAPQPP
jgi:hypothetical protein